jgi:hypothetical protein
MLSGRALELTLIDGNVRFTWFKLLFAGGGGGGGGDGRGMSTCIERRKYHKKIVE